MFVRATHFIGAPVAANCTRSQIHITILMTISIHSSSIHVIRRAAIHHFSSCRVVWRLLLDGGAGANIMPPPLSRTTTQVSTQQRTKFGK